MKDLNSFLVEGRVSGSPEPAGDDGCAFTLVSERSIVVDGVERSMTTWIPVKVYEKLAKSCLEYLRDGKRVRATGEIQQLGFDDSQGISAPSLIMIAIHIDFLPALGVTA